MSTLRSRITALCLCTVAALLGAVNIAAASHHHHRHAERSGAPGDFDYYVLSLSWSPAYCLTHADDHSQCDRQGLGFVLHGLWPQYDDGGYPQECQPDAILPRDAEEYAGRIYPSPALIRHEWERHGTCSGMTALHYFQAADRAAAVVKIPRIFEAPRAEQRLSTRSIIAEFRAANPLLTERSLALTCSRGQLSEVRACLTRDLGLRACGSDVRGNCPAAGTIRVRASR